MLDATNHMGNHTGGDRLHHLDAWEAGAPDAHVFRAFTTLGWENFAEPDHHGVADLLSRGPDSGRDVVERLIADAGLRPVLVGDVDQADALDD